MIKVVLKILILSIVTSLLITGCGGNSEEVPSAPPGGAPPGGAAPGQAAPEPTVPPGVVNIPPGDVPKEQEVAKEQAEAGKQ